MNKKFRNILCFILISISFVFSGCFFDNSTSTNTSTNDGRKITVVFDKQGGYGGSNSVTFISPRGSTPVMPSASAPSKDGYSFKGYYLQANGKGQQYYTSTMSSFRNWQYTVGKTLYARWLPIGIESENVTLNNNNFWDYFENDEALGNAYWYNIRPANEGIVKNTFGTISLTLYVHIYTSAWSSQIAQTFSANIVLSSANNYTTGRICLVHSSDLPSKYSGYSTSISNVSGSITY